MSKNKSDKIKKEDGYDWMVMPDSYFATALLCCETLLRSNINLDAGAFKGFSSEHPNYELIRPLVFNFKQGIELYVKGLAGLFIGRVCVLP